MLFKKPSVGYTVEFGPMSGPDSPTGIVIRTLDGEVNMFYALDAVDKKLVLPVELFLYLRTLQSLYNAHIQWDYESFAVIKDIPTEEK